MVRNPPKGKLEPVLQRERNCNYYDRSSIAGKEKLQLLRPLQYCKQQETANHYDRSIIAKRGELQLPRPFQCCRERNCNYYNRSSIAEKKL